MGAHQTVVLNPAVIYGLQRFNIWTKKIGGWGGMGELAGYGDVLATQEGGYGRGCPPSCA